MLGARVARSALLVWLALSALCCGARPSDNVVLRLPRSLHRQPARFDVRYEPADNVRSARLSALGFLSIERRDPARPLTVHVPELCPVTVAAGPQPRPLLLQSVIELGGDRAALGYDTPFRVSVKHNCPEHGRGEITWRQVEGAPLRELRVAQAGFELSARTERFETLHPEPVPEGIVPIAPRTQGRAVLEARWRGPDLSEVRATLSITAAARSTGLSSVAVSQPLMLSGPGWRVLRAPQLGHGQASDSGALSVFAPDAPGRWLLAHPSGRTLSLQALRHDKTPYDCGRSECHAQIAAATLTSPMSSALERHLDRPSPAAVGCMLECHVLGERGLSDGGFLDVADELGFRFLPGTSWQELPQVLRRLGGVRCTACHGPGAIPEPNSREHVLRSDVCATCHDAPSRYPQVAQWRSGRMSRSDAQLATRAPACAGCHTTAGFLESFAGRAARPATADVEPTGIACAACHAPHDTHRGARLIRTGDQGPPRLPGVAELEPRSALCVHCHAPRDDERRPAASAAALWLGRARLPSLEHDGWEELRAPAAHGSIAGGCVGCHGGGGAAKGRKLDHSFRVDLASCGPCHEPSSVAERAAAVQQSLARRAAELRDKIAPLCGAPTEGAVVVPAHAEAEPAACSSRSAERARYALRLVLEDPAAGMHNAAFARSLLDEALQVLRQTGGKAP